MKSLTLALVLCFPRLAFAAEDANVPREELFNRDWLFALGDHQGAETSSFEDSSWEHLGLPHSFSTPTFGATNNFYVGFGWYRKHFRLPADLGDKRRFLDFEGAFQEAEIFVNGKKVGSHLGGYTGFRVEITAAVTPGENTVAVRVNNRWNPRVAPRAGEHVFSGGLYRNVLLVTTSPLHVAWYGVGVTTPHLSEKEGDVAIETELLNQANDVASFRLQNEIIDPDGRVLSTLSSVAVLNAGETKTLRQSSGPLSKPRLWSPEHPVLYQARTTIFRENTAIDTTETSFGFRWFTFTADKGFFLNGEHRYFHGANVHQDHAGWGDAVTDRGFQRDVALMKEAGFDFIRGSHYPHAPAFAQACDRAGMLFWSENCFWGTGGFDNPWGGSAYPTAEEDKAGFEDSVRASLRDMIRIHRNHPSIVVWSMDNEVFFSDPKVMPDVRRFLGELVAYSHELDPTRPAAIGGAQRGDIDKLGDIAGYNGDGARLYTNPGIPNVVSEYGSTMEDRPGTFAPGWGDLEETPGADRNVPGSWRFPWRSGEIIWCGFDHGSIAGHTFGSMGLVDYFRLPKQQWYWYRDHFRGIPAPPLRKLGRPARLQLISDAHDMLSTNGTEDAHVVVSVVDEKGAPLSNCPTVTLRVESGPGEFPTGDSITFDAASDIPIRDGLAAIEFRSYYSGDTVLRATSPGLEDATLRLRFGGAPAHRPGTPSQAHARPYVRFSAAPASGSWDKFGLENPTRASSEREGHVAKFSNDGTALTDWQASKDDKTPWLRIDLERLVRVEAVRLQFPAQGIWKCRLEVSQTGTDHWQTFEEALEITSENPWTPQTFRGRPLEGRFVRITLLSWPDNASPGIADLSVTGVLTQK